MKRDEFSAIVRSAKAEHPLWFDLEPDENPDADRLEQVEKTLGARLPADYTWFLTEYGGGDFAFASIYSADPESDLYIAHNQGHAQRSTFVAFSDDGTGNLLLFPVVGGVAQDEVIICDHETQEIRLTQDDGFLDFVLRVALADQPGCDGRGGRAGGDLHP